MDTRAERKDRKPVILPFRVIVVPSAVRCDIAESRELVQHSLKRSKNLAGSSRKDVYFFLATLAPSFVHYLIQISRQIPEMLKTIGSKYTWYIPCTEQPERSANCCYSNIQQDILGCPNSGYRSMS